MFIVRNKQGEKELKLPFPLPIVPVLLFTQQKNADVLKETYHCTILDVLRADSHIRGNEYSQGRQVHWA